MPLELASTNLVHGLLESKYWSTGGLGIRFFNSVKALSCCSNQCHSIVATVKSYSSVHGVQVGKLLKICEAWMTDKCEWSDCAIHSCGTEHLCWSVWVNPQLAHWFWYYFCWFCGLPCWWCCFLTSLTSASASSLISSLVDDDWVEITVILWLCCFISMAYSVRLDC